MKRFGSLVILAALGTCAFGAGPSIGVASAVGTFLVNEARVSGSVDLSDGAKLLTTSSPSDVRLQNGAQVRLATRSAGTFFSDHVSLNKGAVRVGSFTGLTVNANQLQIASDVAGAQAVIRMNKKTIEIASIGGAVDVTESGFITRVAAGSRMSFQTGATPTPSSAQQGNTGATGAGNKMPTEKKTFLWVMGVTAAAALAFGIAAAVQGKSPF